MPENSERVKWSGTAFSSNTLPNSALVFSVSLCSILRFHFDAALPESVFQLGAIGLRRIDERRHLALAEARRRPFHAIELVDRLVGHKAARLAVEAGGGDL